MDDVLSLISVAVEQRPDHPLVVSDSHHLDTKKDKLGNIRGKSHVSKRKDARASARVDEKPKSFEEKYDVNDVLMSFIDPIDLDVEEKKKKRREKDSTTRKDIGASSKRSSLKDVSIENTRTDDDNKRSSSIATLPSAGGNSTLSTMSAKKWQKKIASLPKSLGEPIDRSLLPHGSDEKDCVDLVVVDEEKVSRKKRTRTSSRRSLTPDDESFLTSMESMESMPSKIINDKESDMISKDLDNVMLNVASSLTGLKKRKRVVRVDVEGVDDAESEKSCDDLEHRRKKAKSAIDEEWMRTKTQNTRIVEDDASLRYVLCPKSKNTSIDVTVVSDDENGELDVEGSYKRMIPIEVETALEDRAKKGFSKILRNQGISSIMRISSDLCCGDNRLDPSCNPYYTDPTKIYRSYSEGESVLEGGNVTTEHGTSSSSSSMNRSDDNNAHKRGGWLSRSEGTWDIRNTFREYYETAGSHAIETLKSCATLEKIMQDENRRKGIKGFTSIEDLPKVSRNYISNFLREPIPGHDGERPCVAGDECVSLILFAFFKTGSPLLINLPEIYARISSSSMDSLNDENVPFKDTGSDSVLNRCTPPAAFTSKNTERLNDSNETSTAIKEKEIFIKTYGQKIKQLVEYMSAIEEKEGFVLREFLLPEESKRYEEAISLGCSPEKAIDDIPRKHCIMCNRMHTAYRASLIASGLLPVPENCIQDHTNAIDCPGEYPKSCLLKLSDEVTGIIGDFVAFDETNYAPCLVNLVVNEDPMKSMFNDKPKENEHADDTAAAFDVTQLLSTSNIVTVKGWLETMELKSFPSRETEGNK